MSVLPVGIASDAGYQIERSLRFNSADTAYLNRTPGSAGNRKTWTLSAWMKRSDLGAGGKIFGASAASDATFTYIDFNQGKLRIMSATSSSFDIRVETAATLRDPSAWYHLVFVLDAVNSSAKIYVNNVEQTLTVTTPVTNKDYSINNTVTHRFCRDVRATDNTDYLGCYLTEVNFIDGSALTPSSFGQTNAGTGVWEPIKYTGTYGTNGFYLNFKDNSSTSALGTDYSGNGNTWTTNNFSVTAGAGNDSLVDTPTLYGNDTGAGGTVRGNYATLNPLNSSSFSTLSDGNLRSFGNTATNSGLRASTFPATTGKIVWEQTATTVVGNFPELGCVSLIPNDGNGLNLAGSSTLGVQYRSNGVINKNNAVSVGTFSAISSGDVVRFELDVDALTCAIYKNNSLITTVTGLTAGVFYPAVVDYNGSVTNTNFGQRPFANTANSGFKALCTTNLPTPTIAQGDDYFNTVLYTGNDASPRTISGVGFQPDFVWLKRRSTASANHQLFDVVRGISSTAGILRSDTTDAESSSTLGLGQGSALTSDGFSVVQGGTGITNVNASGNTYVAWNWKANGAGVTNTDGTITSTVSANTTAGFSIVTWAGNSTSAATVGHGLGVAPKMIITKSRSNPASWPVGIGGISGFGVNDYLVLNSTNAKATSSTFYQAYGASTFTVGVSAADEMNKTGNNYVSYCFSEVPGYSAFGSYTGNGSTDGPFVYTGFRPRWVMIKRTDAAGFDWAILDGGRRNFNVNNLTLMANTSAAEGTNVYSDDFLSNGFKVRDAGTGQNASGGTYIYMAFAEHPFKHSLAR